MCHSDELGHVLHASDWLADLTGDRDERLAAVRELLIVLAEVGVSSALDPVLLPLRRKLHKISDFVHVHLHN